MKRERLQFGIWSGAALIAGLLLRLWFVAHLGRVAGDGLFYGEIAKTWLQHGIYGVTNAGLTQGSIIVRPTLARLPGYPLFLAACFRLFGMENYRAVLDMQVVIDLVSCCLAGALAARLFGRRAGLIVLWIAALCPFTANYTSTALAETPVFFTIALSFYAFARWQDAGRGYNRWLWVVAAALAYSILLRPEQGLLSAAVLPAMLWRSLANSAEAKRWHAALPVLAAALFVVLPLIVWTARNERIFHVFQPLSPRDASDPGEVQLHGFSRWYDSWAIDFAATDEFCWPMDGEPIAYSNLPTRAFAAPTPAASQAMRRRTAALIDDYNARLTLTPEIDSRFGELGDELVRAHPVQYYFGLHVARMLDMTLRPRTEMMPVADEWWRWKEHRAQTAFATAYALLNLVYMAIAFRGFRVWKRNRWRGLNATDQRGYREMAMAMVASVILRVLLLLFIDNSEPRYTLEFFPVFFVWMGALFAAMRKTVRNPLSI